MSSHVYFYKITPYQGACSVDTSTLDYDEQGYYREEDAPEWAVNYGTFATINNRTIDVFDVGEVLFGRRPTTISMASSVLGVERFYFDDGSIEEIRRSELEDYYYDDVFDGYIYNREFIGDISNAGLIDGIRDYANKVLTADVVERFLKQYMEANVAELDDEYAGSYYLHPVYVLVKTMFEARDADTSAVVCFVE